MIAMSARKKGRGTCKYREENMTCHDICARDKAKCKNKMTSQVSETFQPVIVVVFLNCFFFYIF